MLSRASLIAPSLTATTRWIRSDPCRLAQLGGDFRNRPLTRVEHRRHANEAMAYALVARDFYRDAGLAQGLTVSLAFITQRIITGRQHQRRWQALQVFGVGRAGVRVGLVLFGQVIAPEPFHVGL